MNKIIIAFAIQLLPLLIIAQETTGHLKFKGIPIEGTVYSFAKQLEQKGYRITDDNSNIVTMTGTFANTEGCGIVIYSSSNGYVANVVSVFFPNDNTWGSIYSRYSTLREFLTSKYGTPTITEKFSGYVPTDHWKFEAIKKDECEIHSDYNVTNGTIILEIKKQTNGKVSVVLNYIDSSALEEMSQKIMDDL